MEILKEKKIPIVFVHGNTETGAHWKHIMERFQKNGYDQLFAVSFVPPANGSCITYALQLSSFMKTEVLPKIPANQKVAMIGHSLGVTTIRYYIKNLSGHEHVSHAILIAGANQGISASDTVLLADPQGKMFKQAPELHTGNPPFLQKLNKSIENEESIKYMTLSSPHDYYYSMFEDSPKLDWADNRVIPFKGHWGIRDCDESFELMLAFMEGRENSILIGRALYSHPDRPYGEWGFCDDFTKNQRYVFMPDGKVSFISDNKVVKEGKYTIATGKPANLIDLEFPEGVYYGLYKLSANGDNLALKLGDLNGIRPKSFQYAELYYLIPKHQDIPKELIGKWKAVGFGNMAALIPTEYIATFTLEGTFKLEGKLIIASQFAVEGKFEVEKAENDYKLHLFIEKSNIFLWLRNAYMGAIAHIKDGKSMLFTHPGASKAVCRPQVLDNPIILERID